MLKLVFYSKNKKALDCYLIMMEKMFNHLRIKSSTSIFILPKQTHKITLLKSPHVFKKSKEPFELINYKAVLTFKDLKNTKMLNYMLLNRPKSILISMEF